MAEVTAWLSFQTQEFQAFMSSMMALKHSYLSLSAGGISPRTV